MKKKNIVVDKTSIAVIELKESDYISLTDMVRNLEGGSAVIENWLRNKNTIEFLGIWEELNNMNFNSLEFEGIKNEAGLNRFYLSAKKWIQKTQAIGLISKAGRYGGTYAHKDIAFEFGSWISPRFKLMLLKEFQRLKEIENNHHNIEWNTKRILSKVNYHIQTDAVEKHIIPKSKLPKERAWLHYAEEADLLNVALFGCSAKQWREANSKLASNNKNIRDFASINELAVLANIESLNSEFIKLKMDKEERFERLYEIAKYQLNILNEKLASKSIKRDSEETFISTK
jgi:hypothetical protein